MSANLIRDYWEPGDEPSALLRYFYLDADAQLAALELRQHSIPSFITSSNSQTILPIGQGWIGLHVRERDKQLAIEVLKAAEMWEEPMPQDRGATNNIRTWIFAFFILFLLLYLFSVATQLR